MPLCTMGQQCQPLLTPDSVKRKKINAYDVVRTGGRFPNRLTCSPHTLKMLPRIQSIYYTSESMLRVHGYRKVSRMILTLSKRQSSSARILGNFTLLWCQHPSEQLKSTVCTGGEEVQVRMKTRPVRSGMLTTRGHSAPDRHLTLIRTLPLPRRFSLPLTVSHNHGWTPAMPQLFCPALGKTIARESR